MQFEAPSRSVKEMIDSFESFQRCGPMLASVLRLNGSDRTVDILQNEIDWSDVTKGRPVYDCRVSELRELAPSPRAVLMALADTESVNVKKYSPKMR